MFTRPQPLLVVSQLILQCGIRVEQGGPSWAERAYPNLIYYNKLSSRGTHFAAWEQPDLFVSEMRESFKSLRQ
jgi:hypothetical protein